MAEDLADGTAEPVTREPGEVTQSRPAHQPLSNPSKSNQTDVPSQADQFASQTVYKLDSRDSKTLAGEYWGFESPPLTLLLIGHSFIQ